MIREISDSVLINDLENSSTVVEIKEVVTNLSHNCIKRHYEIDGRKFYSYRLAMEYAWLHHTNQGKLYKANQDISASTAAIKDLEDEIKEYQEIIKNAELVLTQLKYFS